MILTAVAVYAWLAFVSGWARMGWIDWNEQRIRHRYLVRWAALTAAGYAVLAVHSGLGAAGLATGALALAWWKAAAWHVGVSVGGIMFDNLHHAGIEQATWSRRFVAGLGGPLAHQAEPASSFFKRRFLHKRFSTFASKQATH